MYNQYKSVKFIYFDGGGVLLNRKTPDGDNIAKALNIDPSHYQELLNKTIRLQSKEESQKFMEIRTLEQEYSYIDTFHELMCNLLGIEHTPSFIRKLTNFRIQADFEINPGVFSTLQILKENNVKLGVLSNALPSRRHYELQIGGLIDYFDSVVISWEVGFHKPQTEIYEFAIQQSGFKANEILFVDDKISYLKGAEESGISHLVLMNDKPQSTTYPVIKEFSDIVNLLGVE